VIPHGWLGPTPMGDNLELGAVIIEFHCSRALHPYLPMSYIRIGIMSPDSGIQPSVHSPLMRVSAH
jgi:hypothetical protein